MFKVILRVGVAECLAGLYKPPGSGSPGCRLLSGFSAFGKRDGRNSAECTGY